MSDNKQLKKDIESTFDYYRFCCCTPGNEQRDAFVHKVYDAVSSLPALEKEIIQKRYMDHTNENVRDFQVYSFKLEPPISKSTYSKYRRKAFDKLKIMFQERGIM